MRSATAIRTQIEAQLGARASGAFLHRLRPILPTIPTGITDIDRHIGGVPLGALTEFVGANAVSSGLKSLQARILAATTQEHVCACIDATDSFDPRSAEGIGVSLRRLLWIRCCGQGMKPLEQALQCADLLLQASGGFRVIIVDLSGLSPRLVRRVPLSTWFRFRAVVEKQETALVFSTPHAVTSTCSELVLKLLTSKVRWSQPIEHGPTHTRLFAGFHFETEIARKRGVRKPAQSARQILRRYPRLA